MFWVFIEYRKNGEPDDALHFANQHDLGKVHFVEEITSGRTPVVGASDYGGAG